MIDSRALAYVAAVQLAFSALDLYARVSLRDAPSFWAGLVQPWFAAWLVGQVCVAPFQIRLITRQGLGRGVALMNAFSVLYACGGGYLIAHEALRPQDWLAATLVLAATYLFVTTDRSRTIRATPQHPQQPFFITTIMEGVESEEPSAILGMRSNNDDRDQHERICPTHHHEPHGAGSEPHGPGPGPEGQPRILG